MTNQEKKTAEGDLLAVAVVSLGVGTFFGWALAHPRFSRALLSTITATLKAIQPVPTKAKAKR